MKILAVASTLDLKYRLGCTPAWWQLFKGLYETGVEIIATPYLGDPVESLWWRTYTNPCRWESITYNSFLDKRRKSGKSPNSKSALSPVADALITHHIRPAWERHLMDILRQEKGIDAVLIMNVPMSHFDGIPSRIKTTIGIPVIYYDGDMPTSLPKYTVGRGFKFNYYEHADLSEYDAFLTNSEGCISDLIEMGAKNVTPLHFAVDPSVCAPVDVPKDVDVFFFGYGSEFREEWMEKLIAIPSKKMPDVKFVVGGKDFNIDLGNAEFIGDLTYNDWRYYACRSKINLNITRWPHTNVYASSTSRPFELAGFGACIVSQPYNGLEKWFEIGKEVLVVNSSEEAITAFERLLQNPEQMQQMGTLARKRILKEHSFKHRAEQLTAFIENMQK